MSTKVDRQLPRPRKPGDLPVYFDYPGPPVISVCLDNYKEDYREAVHKIWKLASKKGDGLGEEEDFTYMEDQMILKADPRYMALVLVDVSKDEVISAIFAFPSYLCRSENPLFTGGLILVKDAYRSRRVGEYMADAADIIFAAHYYGSLGRGTVTAKSIVPALKANVNFLGHIPWCTQLADKGWIHDVIFHKPWRLPNKEKAEAFSMETLGDRSKITARLPIFSRSAPVENLPVLHHETFGRINIKAAESNEIWEIQHIIRGMAAAGNGFGLDEFNQDGVFNEKLILNCCYWVARKEADGELVAVILSGDTGLCRSYNKNQAAGVIIVLAAFRRQGLGGQLLEWCEIQGGRLGYKYILTDVLACNTPGLGMMRKRGFYITGTLPKSCIVNGSYVDSYVHWKQLNQPNIQSQL